MIRVLLAALAAAGALASAAHAQPLDDTELLRFLVQAQCLDEAGQPTSDTPMDATCARRRAQLAGDLATYRKNDWADARQPVSRAYGYQSTDAVLTAPPRRPGGPATVAHIFDFGAPTGEGFGAFYAPGGDGGDVMVLENGVASIFMTEDGGGGLQWFIGEGCRTRRASPDRAWLAFTRDVGRGVWSEGLARLVIAKDRRTCPKAFDTAYTRWTRADIELPFLRSGAPAGSITVDAIVSEHYDRETIVESNHLERFYFGRDLGKVRWERWEHPKVADPAVLQKAQEMAASARCPRVAYSDAPGPDWFMIDCRQWTNLVPPPQGWSTYGFAWSGLTATAR